MNTNYSETSNNLNFIANISTHFKNKAYGYCTKFGDNALRSRFAGKNYALKNIPNTDEVNIGYRKISNLDEISHEIYACDHRGGKNNIIPLIKETSLGKAIKAFLNLDVASKL